MVPVSACYGQYKGTLHGADKRGISHLDTVDMRRRPLAKKAGDDGVNDITGVYIGIVEELKTRGY